MALGGGASPVKRSRASSPIAVESGTSSADLHQRMGQEPYLSALRAAWTVADMEGLLSYFVAEPAHARQIAAHTRFGQSGKILTNAVHPSGTESFETRGLQRIKHGPCIGIERRLGGMQPVVVMANPKSNGIGRAASFSD